MCRDGEGCGCLHLAAQFGHTALVAYLVAKGQNINTQVRFFDLNPHYSLESVPFFKIILHDSNCQTALFRIRIIGCLKHSPTFGFGVVSCCREICCFILKGGYRLK